jgi:cell pole-organizing protein PopZ
MRYVSGTSPRKDEIPRGPVGSAKNNMSGFGTPNAGRDAGNIPASKSPADFYARMKEKNESDARFLASVAGMVESVKSKLRDKRGKKNHKNGNERERDDRSIAEVMLTEIAALIAISITVLKRIPTTPEEALAQGKELAKIGEAIMAKARLLIYVATDEELLAILPVLEKLLGADHPIVAEAKKKLQAKGMLQRRMSERGGR